MKLSMAAILLAPAAPAEAQQADRYAAGRDVVADIGRVVTPGGVNESLTVQIGGIDQAINIRGADRANPILLFLHGGPGAVEMPIAWTFQRHWEDYFTVVQWDQRGAGKTYALNDPAKVAPTLTLDRFRDDAIQLIDWLRARYGKEKIFLVGHSWGSALGLAVSEARPDLLHAYIGMGQAIDFRENERVGMAWTREQAKKRGDTKAVAAIEALAPYPDSGAFTIDKADAWRSHSIRYGALAAYRDNPDFYMRAARLSPEYDAADLKAWSEGSVFTVTHFWPRLADVSFSRLDRLKIPVILLLGRHDYTVPAPIAADWFGRLRAPSKKLVWLDHSAHLMMLEEPGRVLEVLIDARRLADREIRAATGR